MKRLLSALVLSLVSTASWAAELVPIRSDFATGYDVDPYRIGIVLARHRAAGFDAGRHPEPLLDPAYGRRIPVDHVLLNAMHNSLSNVLRDPYRAQFSDVQMMANAGDTVVVACGRVQDGAPDVASQAFVALFTNPHADDTLQSVGFADSVWIPQTCRAMGFE